MKNDISLNYLFNSSGIITLYDKTLIFSAFLEHIPTSNQSFDHSLDLQRVGESYLDELPKIGHIYPIFLFAKVSIECSVSCQCILPTSIVNFRVWNLDVNVCASPEVQLE
jgi:hypothetical protein